MSAHGSSSREHGLSAPTDHGVSDREAPFDGLDRIRDRFTDAPPERVLGAVDELEFHVEHSVRSRGGPDGHDPATRAPISSFMRRLTDGQV